jgi:hypothetical protein
LANRKKGRRTRPRQRNAGGRSASGAPAEQQDQQAATGTQPKPQVPRKRKERGAAAATGAQRQVRGKHRRAATVELDRDGRPLSPWHPLPLSEILIFVGAIACVIGMIRSSHGFAAGAPTLLSGLVIVGLATMEFTWREHRSGFRSHTILLAVIPVIVVHSAIVLVAILVAKVTRLLNVGVLVAIDLPLFIFLFRALRARFVDARFRTASRR